MEIWTSVLHTIDPAASRLPSLRNPKAVGDALLVLSACMLLAMALLLTHSAGELLDRATRSGVPAWSARLPALSWWLAIALSMAGLWAVRALAPPRGSDVSGAVWKDLWRIAAGLVGWLTFGAIWTHYYHALGLNGMRQQLALHLAMGVFAAVGLLGLRGVLNLIGHRSREYRLSRGSRQSVELIIAAIAVGFLGAAVQYLVAHGILPRWIKTSAHASIWVSNFMILIGLAYMVMNAWWIRQALRKPPPPVDQVLAMDLPPDTWIPDRED